MSSTPTRCVFRPIVLLAAVFLAKMPSGSTGAVLIQSDQGQRVVTKFADASPGRKDVINEFLAAKLFEMLQPQSPTAMLITTTPDFLRGSKEVLPSACIGTHFASLYIENEPERLSEAIAQPSNRVVLARWAVFDLFINDTDRKPEHVACSGGQLYTFDRGGAFGGHHWTADSLSQQAAKFVKPWSYLDSLDIVARPAAAAMLQQIEAMDVEGAIKLIASQMPQEWGFADVDRHAATQFLKYRQRHLWEEFERLWIAKL